MGLQFHAAPDELPGLIAQWIDGENLWVVAEKFFPDYEASPVAPHELATIDIEQVDRIGLTLTEPDLASHGDARWEFLRSNPGSMTVLLSKARDRGLSEAFLTAVTDDPDQLKVWRRVRARAMRAMHQGATLLNANGAPGGEVKTAYYTDGALALARQGMTIRATGGGNSYVFSKLHTP